jgi:hypothetical protein
MRFIGSIGHELQHAVEALSEPANTMESLCPPDKRFIPAWDAGMHPEAQLERKTRNGKPKMLEFGPSFGVVGFWGGR